MVSVVAFPVAFLGLITGGWGLQPPPAGHQAGDLAVMFIGGHGGIAGATATNDMAPPQINGGGGYSQVNGYSLMGNWSGGAAVGSSTDLGPCTCRAYGKVLASSSDPGWEPNGAPNRGISQWVVLRPGVGKTWRDTLPLPMPNSVADPRIVAAADQVGTSGTPLSGTTFAWPAGKEPTAGDAIILRGDIPTDSGVSPGNPTVSCPGLSGGTLTTQYLATGTGVDGAAVTTTWTGFTGTATGPVTVSWAINPTAGSGSQGVITVVAVREMDAASGSPAPLGNIHRNRHNLVR